MKGIKVQLIENWIEGRDTHTIDPDSVINFRYESQQNKEAGILTVLTSTTFYDGVRNMEPVVRTINYDIKCNESLFRAALQKTREAACIKVDLSTPEARNNLQAEPFYY